MALVHVPGENLEKVFDIWFDEYLFEQAIHKWLINIV
jgi:hypothetical protein